MTIRIKRVDKEARLPQYAHPGDAGMDFFSNEEVILKAGERKLVPTGISMAIPDGYVGLFWDKSGIASKFGIKSMAGVIDAGYRGEIRILLHNLSSDEFKIEKGMKIAQMLIQPVEQKELIEVDDLEETERNTGGFGSTGL
tara:strand:+ start:770 stop:1192 length:423 start_codon:yes stop_codon:yes gene_type:complete